MGIIISSIIAVLVGFWNKFLSSIGMSREQRLERQLRKEAQARVEAEAYAHSIKLTEDIFGEESIKKDKRKHNPLSLRKRILLDRLRRGK